MVPIRISPRPQTQAIPMNSDPVIDGEVINDAVWQQHPAFDGLMQVKPNAGQPASEKTDIRIGYTETTLYVSVVCYDSEPEKLVVSDARRDASLDGTDSFLFIIDTYHDRQNGLSSALTHWVWNMMVKLITKVKGILITTDNKVVPLADST